MNSTRLENSSALLCILVYVFVLFCSLCCVCVSQLYAMVSETLRYKPLLDRLVLKADPR